MCGGSWEDGWVDGEWAVGGSRISLTRTTALEHIAPKQQRKTKDYTEEQKGP